MKYDYEFLVDGSPILISDEGVQIAFNDFWADESVQDESGYIHMIPLRLGVFRAEIPYEHINMEEYQYMESLFEGKSTVEVNFWNPKNGKKETRTCYRPEPPTPLIINRAKGYLRSYTLIIEEC